MFISKLDILIKEIFLNFQSIFLFLIRTTLAYGFFEPASNKWQNMDSSIKWFSSIGIPYPHISFYLVASFEALGVILLVLGLFTRFISFSLFIIVLVALFVVHYSNGFSVANNGFEIPLYYALFLGILMSFGAGKISIDNIFNK